MPNEVLFTDGNVNELKGLVSNDRLDLDAGDRYVIDRVREAYPSSKFTILTDSCSDIGTGSGIMSLRKIGCRKQLTSFLRKFDFLPEDTNGLNHDYAFNEEINQNKEVVGNIRFMMAVRSSDPSISGRMKREEGPVVAKVRSVCLRQIKGVRLHGVMMPRSIYWDLHITDPVIIAPAEHPIIVFVANKMVDLGPGRSLIARHISIRIICQDVDAFFYMFTFCDS